MSVVGFRLGIACVSLVTAICAVGGCSSSKTDAPKSRSMGKACVPSDELVESFSGFSAKDVNIELGSPDCDDGAVCLASHFQGRVSCPYGQTEAEASMGTGDCFLPHSDEKAKVAVAPQRFERQPDRAVYCSCRCAGPDASADYCACAAGFECLELVPSVGLDNEVTGSYCVKKGADDNVPVTSLEVCAPAGAFYCGDSRPFPP